MKKIVVIISIFIALTGACFLYFSSKDTVGTAVEDNVVEVDEIILKTGERFPGTIIRRSNEDITIKPVVVGNINAEFTFAYNEIKNIIPGYSSRSAIESHPLLETFVEENTYKMHINDWYQQNRFNELEQEINKLIKNKTHMKSGKWQLDLFYLAISENYEDKTERQLEDEFHRLTQWQSLFPQSSTPIILKIIAFKKLAWYSRGSNFAGGVSRSGMNEYEINMFKAQALIDRQQSIIDPRFYPIAIVVSKVTGNFTEVRQKLLNAAIEFDKNYEEIYISIANYLLRRWGGKPGELEKFAIDAANLSGSDEIYTHIIHKTVRRININGYRRYAFDWQRVKTGYNSILQNNTASLSLLHTQLKLACFYQDIPYAKGITRQTGFLWHQQALNVWGSFSNYYQCKSRVEVSNADKQVNLHLTIRANNMPLFTEMLKNSVINIDKKNINGETALFYAIKNKYYEYVPALIVNGADIRAKNTKGIEVVHQAAKSGLLSVVRLLLEKGVDVNTVTDYNWTPLHYAIRYGHFEVVNLLLSQPAIDVNIRDNKSNTPLHIAVRQGAIRVVNQLLSRIDIDVNVKNRDNKTPLNLALDLKYNDIAKALLDKGAASSDQTISAGDKKNSKALVKQAIEAHNAKNYNKAREWYLKSLDFNPNNSSVYGNLALVDIHLGNYESCVENTQKAIDINPRNAHAIYSTAQCLFMLRKPKSEYLKYYQMYIDIEPDNFQTKKLLKKYPELSVN